MARFTRDALLEYGELAADTLLVLSDIFDRTNRKNLIESMTASRAVVSLFSRVVSGQMTAINAKERMLMIANYIGTDNVE